MPTESTSQYRIDWDRLSNIRWADFDEPRFMVYDSGPKPPKDCFPAIINNFKILGELHEKRCTCQIEPPHIPLLSGLPPKTANLPLSGVTRTTAPATSPRWTLPSRVPTEQGPPYSSETAISSTVLPSPPTRRRESTPSVSTETLTENVVWGPSTLDGWLQAADVPF